MFLLKKDENMRRNLTLSYMETLEKFYKDGFSVDTSKGGLGIQTNYPLEVVDIMFFERNLK